MATQEISLRRVPWSAEMLDQFRQADHLMDTSGGLVPIEALTHHALFAAELNGAPIVHYVVAAEKSGGLINASIEAALGGAHFDLTKKILPLIEESLQGADVITINTRRRGLVRKLLKQGYSLDAMVLRKRKVQ